MALTTGVTTVTTHGTRVVLAATASANSGIVVKALSTNTGLIYVGTSSVSSVNGFQLGKSEAITIITGSPATIYIDSAVDGEGVSWLLT